MPGKSYYEQQIGQSTARTLQGAERGAISSGAYGGAVASAQDKELQAIQNLAQMNAQWQAQQQQGLAGAYGQMGQLKDTQFQQNVLNPWNMKANIASEKAGTGAINQANAANDLTSTVMQFVGTTYYNQILADLQKNKG
jgi:hypothetical protein